MLFRHELAAKVLAGTKTQTRRLAHRGERVCRDDGGDIVSVTRPRTEKRTARAIRFRVGQTYAVQPGRGRQGVGFVRLTAIREQSLLDISQEDARAEGFQNATDFVLAFYQINRGTVGMGTNPRVFVLTVEAVKP
jgi:hypothetical protein